MKVFPGTRAELSDVAIVIDGNDHIAYWNAAAERLYGLRSDEVVGAHLTEVERHCWLNPKEDGQAGDDARGA